jgi:Ca2+-binding EF-hand superfamily protein
MKAIDLDGTGNIDVAEFRGAVLMISTSITEDQIKYAFNFFDRDECGVLHPEDILASMNITDESTKKLRDA